MQRLELKDFLRVPLAEVQVLETEIFYGAVPEEDLLGIQVGVNDFFGVEGLVDEVDDAEDQVDSLHLGEYCPLRLEQEVDVRVLHDPGTRLHLVLRLPVDVLDRSQVVREGNATELFDLPPDNFLGHLTDLLYLQGLEDGRRQLVLRGKGDGLEMVPKEPVEEEGLSPDVLEEEELVELALREDEEVKYVVGGVVLEDSLRLHAEYVVLTEEGHVSMLRLLAQLLLLVEGRRGEWACEQEIVNLLLLPQVYLRDRLCRVKH